MSIPYLRNSSSISADTIITGGLVSYASSGKNDYAAARAYSHDGVAVKMFDAPAIAYVDTNLIYKNVYDPTKPVYAIIAGPYAKNYSLRYRGDCGGWDSNNKMVMFAYIIQDETEAYQFYKAKKASGFYFLHAPIEPSGLADFKVKVFQCESSGILGIIYDADNGLIPTTLNPGTPVTHELTNPDDFSADIANLQSQVAGIEEDITEISGDINRIDTAVSVIGANVGKTISTFVSR